jgi:hypothetical protein
VLVGALGPAVGGVHDRAPGARKHRRFLDDVYNTEQIHSSSECHKTSWRAYDIVRNWPRQRMETIRIDSVIEGVGDLAGFLDGDVALDPPEPVPQGAEGAVPLASGGHRSDSCLELVFREIRGIEQR